MVVALLYEMQSPCNCFTLSLSGSDSRRRNSWRDGTDATMEIKVSDTSILHHVFISIFIALWAVITRYVTILIPDHHVVSQHEELSQWCILGQNTYALKFSKGSSYNATAVLRKIRCIKDKHHMQSKYVT